EIDSDASRAAPHEDGPSPRWIGTPAPPQPVAATGTPAPDVLIAGCSTGLSAIEFAKRQRTARILAVDLSRANLSYASRMARNLGLSQIEFAQADIVRLGTLGRTFDLIDASGALRHRADPWQCWRALLPLLRPGGFMQIGIYSVTARENIAAAH